MPQYGRKSSKLFPFINLDSFDLSSMFQAWSYTSLGELRADEMCLEAGGSSGAAKLQKCHRLQGNQKWKYDLSVSRYKNVALLKVHGFHFQTKQLLHVNTNTCLSAKGETPAMVACDPNNPAQHWILEDYTSAARPASDA